MAESSERRGTRQTILALVGALCLVSAALGVILLLGRQESRVVAYVVVVTDPLLAALLLCLLAMLLPRAFAGPRPAFPMNLTWPTLHAALLLTIKALSASDPTALVKFGKVQRYDQLWASPLVILVAWVAQAVVLSVLVWTERPRSPS